MKLSVCCVVYEIKGRVMQQTEPKFLISNQYRGLFSPTRYVEKTIAKFLKICVKNVIFLCFMIINFQKFDVFQTVTEIEM